MAVQSLALPFPSVSFFTPRLSSAAASSSSSSSSPSPSSLICRRFCGPYPCCFFVLRRSFDLPIKIGVSQGGRSASHVVRMAPEEEKMTRRSPLDFPIEWERPKPGRRPDIFPQFSPMKTPLPPPLPADPPEEDEEEVEKKEEEEEDPEKEETDKPEKQ